MLFVKQACRHMQLYRGSGEQATVIITVGIKNDQFRHERIIAGLPGQDDVFEGAGVDELFAGFVFFLLLAVLWIARPHMLHLNIMGIFIRQIVPLGILVLGQMLVMRVRSIDLSGGGIILLKKPEGGLDETERQAAIACGYRAVRMGPRVMRTETAPLAALAAMQALWGDFR